MKKQKRELSAIPSVVQLPGGVRLSGVPFRVTEYAEDGTPKIFEILPQGASTGRGIWTLFADEEAIRASVPEAQR